MLVDGIETAVTCPGNVRGGSYFRFRPFDSFDLEAVRFRASNHGLILNKIPGQKFLQLTDIVEGSVGSKCKCEGSKREVATLAQEKYFLRAIGPKAAPSSIESALEALQTSSYPLVLVFGPTCRLLHCSTWILATATEYRY